MKNMNMKAMSVSILGFCFVLISMSEVMAQIPVQNNDADTLGIVSLVDKSEIQMGILAQEKQVDLGVIDYARMLVNDHYHNLEVLDELSKQWKIMPAKNSPTLDQLKSGGQKDMSDLSSIDGADFSKQFITDMIKGHTDVLNWLDAQNTSDGRVKKFLDETKKVIAKHLNKAQQLQDHEQA